MRGVGYARVYCNHKLSHVVTGATKPNLAFDVDALDSNWMLIISCYLCQGLSL